MNVAGEQILMSKIRTLSPQQVSEVEDFVEFLTAKARKRSVLDRLLAIAPALEAAGVAPMSEDEIAAEIKARGQAPGQAPRFHQQRIGCGSFLTPTWCYRPCCGAGTARVAGYHRPAIERRIGRPMALRQATAERSGS